MQLEVRAARTDEWEASRALRLQMLADTPHAFGDRLEDVEDWDEQRWRRRAASMLLSDAAWFVAVDADGAWHGQAAVRDYAGSAWLLEVFVGPALRGTGLAAELLASAERWATARGHSVMFLTVDEQAVAARRFYTRSGFVESGATTPHPLYPDHLEYEMFKPLRSS